MGMDLFFGAVVLLLVLGAIWLMVRLLRAIRPQPGAEVELNHRLARVRERRDALGEELRTAELDFRLGRISADDFRTERARLEPDLVNMLAELDRIEPVEDSEEAA